MVTLIEFVGFVTLGYEVRQTTKITTIEAVDIAQAMTSFDQLIISDGPEGRVDITGGVLGKQIDSRRKAVDELRERMTLIVRGLVISAAGAALQVAGNFGQAMNAN
ncbi:hypothetical protein [Bradyrhizobium sp. B120]|uniref:hypothetical protein n=1 Tax=Bradyrhizobium sp. B120 TaxID=3410088 RepID=UPI003B9866C7